MLDVGETIGHNSGLEMFKIIVEFTRPNNSHKFFYEEFAEHPVVLSLKNSFESHPGFKGKEIFIDSDNRLEVAMNFDTVENFLDFAKTNQDMLDKRMVLIQDWCEKTGQTFSHKTLEV